MIHNGIEYSDMQLIAEAYDLIRRGTGKSPAEIADIFAEWNKGELESYLIEITAEVLRQVDAKTGKPLVDVILDQAGAKGTGAWTVQTALALLPPLTTAAPDIDSAGQIITPATHGDDWRENIDDAAEDDLGDEGVSEIDSEE